MSSHTADTQFLSSGNPKDVKEFQKKLQRADFDLARHILRILDLIAESQRSFDDPAKIEKRRVELETMVKGEYREGRGWEWNGHVVPPPPSTDPYFARRKRIVGNGTWNPTRLGWEYQGEFFGIKD